MTACVPYWKFSEPPGPAQNGDLPTTKGGVCSTVPWPAGASAGRRPRPSCAKPETRPPMRNTQASGSVAVPNDGARPPGAGGVGGASGETLAPIEPEALGRPSLVGGASVAGCACCACASAGKSRHAAAESQPGLKPPLGTSNFLCELATEPIPTVSPS